MLRILSARGFCRSEQRQWLRGQLRRQLRHPGLQHRLGGGQRRRGGWVCTSPPLPKALRSPPPPPLQARPPRLTALPPHTHRGCRVRGVQWRGGRRGGSLGPGGCARAAPWAPGTPCGAYPRPPCAGGGTGPRGRGQLGRHRGRGQDTAGAGRARGERRGRGPGHRCTLTVGIFRPAPLWWLHRARVLHCRAACLGWGGGPPPAIPCSV